MGFGIAGDEIGAEDNDRIGRGKNIRHAHQRVVRFIFVPPAKQRPVRFRSQPERQRVVGKNDERRPAGFNLADYLPLHLGSKRLRFHQRVGVNVAGSRLAARQKIDLRLRTKNANARIRRRIFPDILRDNFRFRQRVAAIKISGELRQRRSKPYRGAGENGHDHHQQITPHRPVPQRRGFIFIAPPLPQAAESCAKEQGHRRQRD